MNLFVFAGLLAVVASCGMCLGAALEGGINPERVKQIAATLSDEPYAFGPKISDRAGWEKLRQNKTFEKVIADAEKRLTQPMPAMTEEIYTEYKRTGQRTKNYGQVRSARHGLISLYTMAECLENKGRFIAPLESAIRDICSEPTWVFNFHDADLSAWSGKKRNIDLGSSLFAQSVAQAYYLLGEKLSPEVRALMEKELDRRIIDPYRQYVQGTATDVTGLWWVTTENNWNAVCHNGVLGTALAMLPKKEERAWFIASAEKFSHHFLRGFGPDGYCAEGMGYWNYGFGNYVELAELIWQATDGKVDLYELPGARISAMYPARIHIQEDVFPAYADCRVGSKPSANLVTLINRHYGLGLTRWQVADVSTRGELAAMLMRACPNSATKTDGGTTDPATELRTYFDAGGVLNCRPAKGGRFAVSLKGGHNNEPHNHNDLGTFVVVLGKATPLLDPGLEEYSARTFSKDRYKSNLLNSWGHPVPMLAGQMQRAGKDAAAKILKTDFSDQQDVFSMDLASAYAVPELTKMVRTFTYSREGAGSLEVVDEVAFSEPSSYATALVTYGTWKLDGDDALLVTAQDETVRVTINTNGAPFDIVAETINENTGGEKPTRIGINLREPLSSGRIVLMVEPAK